MPQFHCVKCDKPAAVLEIKSREVGVTYYVNCHGRVQRVYLHPMNNALATYQVFGKDVVEAVDNSWGIYRPEP